MIRTLMRFMLMGFVILACKSGSKSTQNNIDSRLDCIEMKLLTESPDALRQDPYELDSIVLENGCLNVFVKYGGGCGEASFDLYYSQIVSQSMPPQTALHLEFEDQDPCRSVVSKKLSFDVSPFSEAAKSGGILLLLGELRVLYSSQK